MGRWSFSNKNLDPAKTAIASGRDLRISYKHAVEICAYIRNLPLKKAKNILEEVIEKRRAIPFKRYKGKVGHKRGLHKWYAGRYPVKAAKAILKLLNEAEANAEFKGLDIDNLWIVHAAAHKGMKIRKYIPRAFGRSTPYFQQLVHVEIGLEER